MKETNYDGMLLFDVPVIIDNDPDNSEPLTVFGFLYPTSEHGPKFTIRQEVYACYLMALEKLGVDGGRPIDNYTWQTGDGRIYDISSNDISMKIYKYMKPQLKYKLYEFSQDLKYSEDEVCDGLILKPSLHKRYGVSFIEAVNNIQHNRVM